MKISYFLFLALLLGCLFAGEGYTMSNFSNDFQNIHHELFQDVKNLNQYTRTHQVELKNVDVKDIDLDGAEFLGATFSKVRWENVNLENAIFTKVVFDSCKFENSSLDGSKFIDCIFKNCEFNTSSVSHITLQNGHFLNCRSENSFMNQWQGDEVVFNGGKILDTPLAQGKIKYIFKKIELDGVRVMMTEGMSPLTIEDCVLSEVDFSKSHFSDVVLRRVTQGEGPTRFNSTLAESFTFDDVDMTRGVSLAHVKAKFVRIVGGKFGAAFEGSTIAKVVARDAFLANIDFSEAQMPLVEIGACELDDLALWEGVIKDFSITNSHINILDATDFKADTVVWDNVTLDGKIDLTNAQVKDFRPTRLKRGPKLQLITIGSNIRFN